MKEVDNEVNLLKSQINKLNLDLEKKDAEINESLEKIQDLEDEVLKFSDLISGKPSQEKIKKAIETKFTFELNEKGREIRDLKNRMGFLRKEKAAFQRELEEFKKKITTSVISVEEIREKEKLVNDLLLLETSTNELRKKMYSQEILTGHLKDEISEKEKQIKHLEQVIEELNQKLKIKNSFHEGKIVMNKALKKELNKELQRQLNKSKAQIDDLKEKIAKYRKSERDLLKKDIEINDLRMKIIDLKEQLDYKDSIIADLESKKEFF